MGCLDGAEVCNLNGLYVLSKLKTLFENQNDVGLYKDDDLGILPNLSDPQIERARRKNCKNFQRMGIINNNQNKPQGCTVS